MILETFQEGIFSLPNHETSVIKKGLIEEIIAQEFFGKCEKFWNNNNNNKI